MEIDPEKVLGPTAQARFDDAVESDVFDGLVGQGDISGADIARDLARHGVTAEASHIEPGDIAVGVSLLSRAADEGADLLVMGVYGHSRLRELVLGGVSQHLFDHVTIPVFMAH